MVIAFLSLRSLRSSGRKASDTASRGWGRRFRDTALFSVALWLAGAPGYAVTQNSTTKKTATKSHKTAPSTSATHKTTPTASTTHKTTQTASTTHRSVYRYAALPSNFRWRVRQWNPIFPGSHELLVQQNQELDRTQSFRVINDVDLIQHELSQDLVPVNETEALKLADNLDGSRRYCRPSTRDFLQDFSQAFYEQFHAPLTVNSLVRTMEQQHKLRRHNRFAAPEWGDTASTHLAGVAFDLSRRGLTPMQYAWITTYLLPLKEAGMVDPIEERQPVLHIVVYDKYGDHSGGASSLSEANEPTEMTVFDSAGGSQP
jgi:Family of unknown function (DUF5715)